MRWDGGDEDAHGLAFYDHNSMLRTIEDAFGIGEHLNNAASSKVHPMTDLFRH
jgi:hypothetical protein